MQFQCWEWKIPLGFDVIAESAELHVEWTAPHYGFVNLTGGLCADNGSLPLKMLELISLHQRLKGRSRTVVPPLRLLRWLRPELVALSQEYAYFFIMAGGKSLLDNCWSIFWPVPWYFDFHYLGSFTSRTMQIKECRWMPLRNDVSMISLAVILPGEFTGYDACGKKYNRRK